MLGVLCMFKRLEMKFVPCFPGHLRSGNEGDYPYIYSV
jgi:hypothetical protein